MKNPLPTNYYSPIPIFERLSILSPFEECVCIFVIRCDTEENTDGENSVGKKQDEIGYPPSGRG